jgi:hypothetical protein
MPFGIVLVEVSQVVLLAFADADASIHYIMTGVFEITLNETGIRNGHVAVQEKNPFILGMLGQKVACRGTASIGWLLQESAVLKLFYDLVGLDDFRVCGSIVGN